MAKTQADAGADYIDVCASDGVAVELETMKWLIKMVQEATDTAIAVDSPNASICAAGGSFCKKPGLVNSVPLEGSKIDVVFPVIADTPYHCATLPCDDTGIPKSSERYGRVLHRIH